MFDFMLSVHSVLRYVVLALVAWALVRSIAGWLGKRTFNPGDRKVAMFAMISAHIQLLIGIFVYIFSDITRAALSDMGSAMKNSALRFWSVEHVLMMLVAIVLFTIGHSKAKKGNPVNGHRTIAIFFLLGLIVMLAAIPWPFSANPRPWY